MNKNKHKRKRNERRIREKQDMKKQQPNTGMEKKREIITTGICVCVHSAQPLPLFQMEEHDQTRICALVDRIMITILCNVFCSSFFLFTIFRNSIMFCLN